MEIPFEQFPGLGCDEYPGFPVDECPALPDLSRHCSVCTDILKAHPEIYEDLKNCKTSKGVTLARCIKTGIDNCGHPAFKSLGAVAGDVESYDTFAPLFDKLLERRHGEVPSLNSKCYGRRSLTTESAEPFGGYVMSCKVAAWRSLDVRFPPAASLQDREEVERILVDCAMAMEGNDLKGQYYPLTGSNSYPSKPGGMSSEERKMLADNHLFDHPDAPNVLSTGAGRHWPHGRGVFTNERRSLTLWINEEEHLKATSQQTGGNVQAAYLELSNVLGQMSSKLPAGFAYSKRLGYLTSNPANLGTALRVSASVRIPFLKHFQDDLKKWCAARDLETSFVKPDLVEVSTRVKMNITEEEMVNQLVENLAQLVRAERLMEQGIPVDEALARGLQRGDLTPVDPETTSWDAAGNALREMFSSAVDSCGVTPVDIAPLETMQRLAGALVIASEVNSLQDAAAILQQEKAAVKIQALQRGRSERKVGEESRSQSKGLEAEICRQVDDFQKLRFLLAELLASAAQDGSLQKALAIGKPPDMADDEKEVLRLQLESSLDRGGLAKALAQTNATGPEIEGTSPDLAQHAEDAATIIMEENGENGNDEDSFTGHEPLKIRIAYQLLAAEMEGSLEKSFIALRDWCLEDLRQKAALELEAACKDGLLEVILSKNEEVKMAKNAARKHQDLRNKAAGALISALDDGSLEAALRAPRKDDLEALRCKVARRLEAGLNDGSLQAALRDGLNRRQQSKKDVAKDQIQVKDEMNQSLDHLRYRVALQLEASCANGSLEKLLAKEETHSSKALREKVAQTLESALVDGSLETALEASMKQNQGKLKSDPKVDELRQKAAKLLAASCANGAIEAALSSQAEKKQEALRNEVARRLEAACDDGTLEVAVKAIAANQRSKGEVEAVRKKIAFRLQESATDGTLEAALAATSGSRSIAATAGSNSNTFGDLDDSEDLRSKVGQQLSEAFFDGSLEAALDANQRSEDGMDNLKSMLADSLSNAFVNGSLEAALEATNTSPMKEEKTIKPISEPQIEGRIAKPTRPPSAQAKSGAAALLQVMSSYDRRIGKLLEWIQAAEQEILQRSQLMAMLEVQVEEAQQDLRSLDQAWERQQLAVEQEEARDLKLQEEKKRLTESLKLEKLKQRHAAVDLDGGYSARSELTSAPSRLGASSPGTTPWSWRSQA